MCVRASSCVCEGEKQNVDEWFDDVQCCKELKSTSTFFKDVFAFVCITFW